MVGFVYHFVFCLFVVAELNCVRLRVGYGATTLPGLTEAITIEKNSTLAQGEVTRLQVLIDNIVKTIKLEESRVVRDM